MNRNRVISKPTIKALAVGAVSVLLCSVLWFALWTGERNRPLGESERDPSVVGRDPTLRGISGWHAPSPAGPPRPGKEGEHGGDEAVPVVRLWLDNEEGDGWIQTELPRRFHQLEALRNGEKLVVIGESGGRVRIALPPGFERPRIRVLTEEGKVHPHVTAHLLQKPEAGTVNETPVQYVRVGLIAADWQGGLEHLTLEFIDHPHKIRGRIAIASCIAAISPYNIGRDRFGIALAISRIRGLSSVRLRLACGGRVLEPVKSNATLQGVIETTDFRGEYREYRGLDLPLGAEEELTDFVIHIDAVFKSIDLEAVPGIAQVRITDGNGMHHEARINVACGP